MDTGENISTTSPSFDLSVPERSLDTSINPRFGFLRSETTAVPRGASSVDKVPVTVQRVPAGIWSDAHLARLRTTAPTATRNTDGIVPIARVSGEPGKDVEVVSLRTDAPRFQERLDFRTPPAWNESAGVTLAAAEAMEKAHSLGLRHGALQPEDVVVDGNELAIAGMGLSLGGTPEAGTTMAPEVASSGVPTVPGDVYSLGKLLETATVGDTSTPAAIQSVIADATAEDPNERIPSAREFADRLRVAGGDAIRTYKLMSFADSPLVVAGAATGAPALGAAAAGAGAVAAGTAAGVASAGSAGAAATSLAATTPAPATTGRRALPWIAAAGLAGLVGIGLWAASGDDGSNRPSTDTTVATTTSEPTTRTSDTIVTTTSTNEPTSTSEPTTTATTEPTTNTTDASTSTTGPTTTEPTTTTTTAPTTSAPPTTQTVPGATPVQDAGLEILHGIPNTPVDAYLDGELVLANFNSGEIAGPLDLPAGQYGIDLFAAGEDPAAARDDREDTALASTTLGITEEPLTVVVVSTANGEVQFQSFADDLDEVAAGEGRLSIRNPGPGPATVRIEGAADTDPVEVQLPASAAAAVDLAAGDYTVTLTDQDGETIVSGLVSNAEGSLTTATVISSDSGEAQLLLQRISGLGSPPEGIPTGDSGLLPGPNDGRTAGLLLAGLGAAGLLGVVGNQRLRRNS